MTLKRIAENLAYDRIAGMLGISKVGFYRTMAVSFLWLTITYGTKGARINMPVWLEAFFFFFSAFWCVESVIRAARHASEATQEEVSINETQGLG